MSRRCSITARHMLRVAISEIVHIDGQPVELGCPFNAAEEIVVVLLRGVRKNGAVILQVVQNALVGGKVRRVRGCVGLFLHIGRKHGPPFQLFPDRKGAVHIGIFPVVKIFPLGNLSYKVFRNVLSGNKGGKAAGFQGFVVP